VSAAFSDCVNVLTMSGVLDSGTEVSHDHEGFTQGGGDGGEDPGLLGAIFGATMLLSNQHAATAPQPTVTLQAPQHTPQEGVNR
jgi:hypothetical protein